MYTDVQVALEFLSTGDHHWAGWTLALIFAPFFASCIDFIFWACQSVGQETSWSDWRKSFFALVWKLPMLHILK